jgi:hypothetical protein
VPLALRVAAPAHRLVDLLEEGETQMQDGGRVELTISMAGRLVGDGLVPGSSGRDPSSDWLRALTRAHGAC